MIGRVSSTAVFALNVHSNYRCRHSGACCTAGWTIPVEPKVRGLLKTEWLVPAADGACPQFDRQSGLCLVHRDHGELMQPESCHHFPRRALTDSRGTFITLSHFCPTAAALLLDGDEPLAIVANPRAFPPGRAYDGLTTHDDWPPLLRPGVLFDSESFTEWERYLVRTTGSSTMSVELTLARIAGTGERLRRWTTAEGPLFDWSVRVLTPSEDDSELIGSGEIGEAGSRHDDWAAASRYEALTRTAAYTRTCATVPAGLSSPALSPALASIDEAFVQPAWAAHARLVLRYLGTRAFGSWTAYQSRGIRTQIGELFIAATVLRVECARACEQAGRVLDRDTLLQAVRASDWLLVHLVDREALMAWLGTFETDGPALPRR